jgi:hypothetical protein
MVRVGTIPRGNPDGDAAAALDQAITTAAGRRAVVVDLGAIDVRDDGADRQIARRFATALRAS